MDADRFDVVTRSLTGDPSRRGLLGGLGGSLLALSVLGMTGADANAKKKKQKNKRKNKDKKKNEQSEPAAPLCPSPPPPPGQAQPQLAGGCQAASVGVTSFGVGVRLAQTFVANRGGTLQQISVAIQKEASSAGNYVVQLVPAPGGQPAHASAAVFAASTIDNGDVATGDSTLVVTFAGTSLVAGQPYAVVVNRLEEGLLLVHLANGTVCPNSAWFYAFGESSFSAAPNADMIVSVFVV